jgi:hypothetical protein
VRIQLKAGQVARFSLIVAFIPSVWNTCAAIVACDMACDMPSLQVRVGSMSIGSCMAALPLAVPVNANPLSAVTG